MMVIERYFSLGWGHAMIFLFPAYVDVFFCTLSYGKSPTYMYEHSSYKLQYMSTTWFTTQKGWF